MDASIEMKVQKLDELIELRKKCIELQEELGMDIGTHGLNNILVFDKYEFLEIAKHTGGKIEVVNESHGAKTVEFTFSYKELEINTRVFPKDLAEFLLKIKK